MSLNNTMFVYRIEDRDGRGPYSCGAKWEDERHNSDNGHPSPTRDGLYRYWHSKEPDINLKFGFTSTKQFRHWFSRNEQTKLLKFGYKLTKFKAELCDKSERQCVYYANTRRDKNDN